MLAKAFSSRFYSPSSALVFMSQIIKTLFFLCSRRTVLHGREWSKLMCVNNYRARKDLIWVQNEHSQVCVLIYDSLNFLFCILFFFHVMFSPTFVFFSDSVLFNIRERWEKSCQIKRISKFTSNAHQNH